MTDYEVNYQFQRALYGKELSCGEIGCAISHQETQSILADSIQGGVILEDDARVPNLAKFEKVVTSFLSSEENKVSVLSLLPWNHKVRQLNKVDARYGFYKLLGQTPLNVGYAITKKAALNLAVSNLEYAFLPDWPPNQAHFFTTIAGVVIHGDDETISILDLYGRNKLPRRYGFQKFLIYPYFTNKKFFSSLFQYLKIMIFPSITWRIDNARFSRKRKRI
jgi:GR25 family glycosyltransferase involved in LPS biosynthesis